MTSLRLCGVLGKRASEPRRGGPDAGLSEQGEQFFRRFFGGGGVLACHQLAVGNDEACPVIAAHIVAAVVLEHVFHQKRHYIREADAVFLAVGEPRYFAARNEGRITGFRVLEDRRGVADGPDGAVGFGEGFDQADAVRVFGQIPQRAVTAGVEYRVIAIGGDCRQNFGRGQRLLCIFVGFEALCRFGLRVIRVAFGVERGLAA